MKTVRCRFDQLGTGDTFREVGKSTWRTVLAWGNLASGERCVVTECGLKVADCGKSRGRVEVEVKS